MYEIMMNIPDWVWAWSLSAIILSVAVMIVAGGALVIITVVDIARQVFIDRLRQSQYKYDTKKGGEHETVLTSYYRNGWDKFTC